MTYSLCHRWGRRWLGERLGGVPGLPRSPFALACFQLVPGDEPPGVQLLPGCFFLRFRRPWARMLHFFREDLRVNLKHFSWGLLAMWNLRVESLFRESRVRHADGVARPAELMETGQCFDAGDVGLSGNTDVDAPILPVDLQDVAEAALVVVLRGFEVSDVHSPPL